MKNKLFKLLIVLMILLFLFVSCARKTSNQQTSSSNYTEYVVTRQNLTDSLTVYGTLNARKVAEVRPLVSGVVKKVHVSKGDTVKAGDILIEIDDTDYRLAYIKALQNYESAKLTGSKLLLQQRELELKIAERDLERCTVKAPIDGVVVSLDVTEGSIVSASTIVAKIVNMQNLYVSANVDEIDYSKVSVGQFANITFDAFPNMGFSGRVSYISKEAQTAGGITVVPIEVDLLTGQQTISAERRQQMMQRFQANVPSNLPQNISPETLQQMMQRFSSTQRQIQRATDENLIQLIPGLSCQVEIIVLNKPNAIVVPTRAIQFEDGQAYVTVKVNEKTEKRLVKLGERTSAGYEILEGLEEGEVVLVPVTQRTTTTSTGTGTIFNPFTGPQMRIR
ncbi:efflux RND transporter periplasmic adaptor subunit [Pseudothermotoga thermarum]|uniref:Efflux transporter, RND family, MFP subunit n=1 Tax=Pseudothermotoga thermarum DSM 5069 TaxID=688269 RepID=F7YXU0_9THEM|nr:efflux RND transporter periplasmic adaptor subunit [Pseudothermotoga thermarum]AEH50736.1 efflux transporter, RND family, MFP subunit [Pseudothermotoga thermarum DSM 5069]